MTIDDGSTERVGVSRRLFASSVVFAALALLGSVVSAPPASAGVLPTACKSTFTVNLPPGDTKVYVYRRAKQELQGTCNEGGVGTCTFTDLQLSSTGRPAHWPEYLVTMITPSSDRHFY